MSAARAKKEKPAPGPDDLVRTSAGSYRTGDGRFEVQKSDLGWYIVDTAQTNEFGQQLIHGPVATLDGVRIAIPGARDIKPLLRTRAPSQAKKNATVGESVTKPNSDAEAAARKVTARPEPISPPPPPPPSWIELLPIAEAASIRRLIRALAKEGVEDADGLVRRQRDGDKPIIATKILEQRLRALIDEQSVDDRERAEKLVRAAAKILTQAGMANSAPLPRWALVEIVDDDEPPTRRVTPRI